MGIKILLADDHKIVRMGLRSLIENDLGLEVVGEADDGRQAVDLAVELEPDVVIMDVTMPGLNGIEATRLIAAHNPAIKILALSMHADKRFVVGILRAGAAGYLLKDCAFEEMASAIKAVNQNGTYLSPGVAGKVIEDYVRRLSDSENNASGMLSSREKEVLQLLAEGHSTRHIASRLTLSVKTVETHRRAVMKKLELYTIAELTKYAIREGITSLDN